ncbi:hypothetical protein LWI29_029108 [Acer saccharum]|uniref:HpcH/HpaI aldolase/citrate lyase domain-containing protein n=1 Tax=Acer saccharum TaxID=4024 RepID=A0AA39VQN1_ACESA|nr:hypothetical protein LWI29_029108 [Acer saccharum]
MATLAYSATAAAAAAAATTKLAHDRVISFPKSSFFSSPDKPKTIFTNLAPLKSSSKQTDLSAIEANSPLSSTTATATKSLKSRLRNNETLYGIFLLSFSPTLAEISGLAGYDFAVVDMEHGPGGISAALECLHALAATRTPAILRLPESSATWAKKALDLGPQGIMFPMIESQKEARKAVSYCRFPPAGVRGSAHTVVRASDYGINEGYLNNYEEELLIMCQVECEDGVKKVEEIAAVDGVDCVQMGPLDLSASMGYLWDPGHKKVREMMRTAEKGVLKGGGGGGGAYLAGFAMPHDGPLDLKSRGYHMVSGTVDVGLFRKAAVEDVRRFKMSLMEGSDDDGERDDKYWSE